MFSKELVGKVVFDIGVLLPTEFGSSRIKGEFPRIKARHQRLDITLEELDSMKCFAGTWLGHFFEMSNDSIYFEEIIECSCLFTAFTYPFRAIGSKKMELALQMNVHLWVLDDYLETALMSQNVPKEIVRDGLEKILQAMQNREVSPVDLEAFPRFSELFNSFVNIHETLDRHIVGVSAKKNTLRFMTERYFNGMQWYPVRFLHGNCSEETFRQWRKIVSSVDNTAERLWILEKECPLSPQILKSPMLERLLDLVNGVVAYTNDLLGIKKDFQFHQTDNLIVFKVIEKNIPLDEAVIQVCTLIREGLLEYLQIRDSILEEFLYDPGLVKYFDVLEGLIDGHNRLYTKCARFQAVGGVTLIDD